MKKKDSYYAKKRDAKRYCADQKPLPLKPWLPELEENNNEREVDVVMDIIYFFKEALGHNFFKGISKLCQVKGKYFHIAIKISYTGKKPKKVKLFKEISEITCWLRSNA